MSYALKNRSILVVDDNADTCELLRTLFQQYGAHVIVAHSVPEAIKAHRECPAHVLVSDIRLGTSDGYALIEAIREYNKKYRGFTPALALTGYVSPGEEQRARAVGFNAYITKPFDPGRLVETVVRLLQEPADRAA